MALAGAWVAFPLLLTLVATCWGLLVEQVAGARIPGALLPALGLAALATALALTSRTDPELGMPLMVAGAAAGIGLCAIGAGPRENLRSLRPTREGALVGLIAFAIFAASVVLSGAPAVSGYIRLDDTTTLLALGDWVFEHGRDTSSLAPSTYEAALQINLSGGYPVGSMLPLVGVGRLSGQELMWLWMPYLAVLGALLALALEAILRPLSGDARVRLPVAILASAAALLVGYVLWGGIKEVWTAALAAVAAALVPWTIEATRGNELIRIARALVPFAITTLGIVTALSVAGLGWTAPALVVLAAGAAIQRGYGRRVPAIVLGLLLVGAAIVPLARHAPFVNELTSKKTGPEALGNLLEPLGVFQVVGIWPADDFRIDPSATFMTTLLVVAVVVGAAWGLARALDQRAWALLAYGPLVLVALAIVTISNWPWAEAKALAIASPVPLALAGAGAADLMTRGTALRVAGGVVLAALVAGVLWSDVLGARGTTLTPYDRHDELAQIGERFAGRGPALMTEYDPFAARWFLRKLDIEGASELRRRIVPLADGGVLAKGESGDIDRFAVDALSPYELLVLRRSPFASRPPSSFERVYRGQWYEVWQRNPAARPVIDRLALGNSVDPGGVARCSNIRRLASKAGPSGVLIAATAQNPSVAGLEASSAPPTWSSPAPGTLTPDESGNGQARAIVTAPGPGRYEVWLGGAFRGRADVSVDGRDVGAKRHQLSYPGNVVPFSDIDLTAGPHAVRVRLHSELLRPGTRGLARYTIGPVALLPAGQRQDLIQVPSSAAAGLCRQRLDWVEAAR